MKKIGLNAIKTRPHLIAKFPHLFQPGGGFPHLDQILDLTLVPCICVVQVSRRKLHIKLFIITADNVINLCVTDVMFLFSYRQNWRKDANQQLTQS